MAIDFGKLKGGISLDTTKSPHELFKLLPAKKPRYLYLRDVQADVLAQWSDRRDERNLTIKMNTGSGKTVVALLVLKTCLNEGVGPAVYIAPSPYLAEQVTREAQDLGIEVTDNEKSLRFVSGKQILVIGIHKLINGLSVFGVGDQGPKIQIGSIVIDDTHACLETAVEQFTLRVSAPHAVYKEMLKIFQADLEQQSPSGLIDLLADDPHKTMLVPYWGWIKKQAEVQQCLRAYLKDDSIKELRFVFPLLKDHLHLCRCVFGAAQVEITSHCLPISMIPSFGAARRRVFMSATFRNDSILITHFDADPTSVQKVISPATGGDIGDRMILVPQEANPNLDDTDLKSLFKDIASKHNVVVLVPSEFRAKFWADVAAQKLTATNLTKGVEALKNGHVGLVVLVNKYDGIDLPDSACRVLVIDGLPDTRRKIDKIEQAVLAGSDLVISKAIQRIEQGMGRGIRSIDDYCAVFLMGRSLTSQLYATGARNFFTPATRAQFELSNQLASQLQGSDLGVFRDVVNTFLARNVDWVSAGRAAVVGAEYVTDASISEADLSERRAFNAASNGDFPTAIDEAQKIANQEKNPRVQGWLKFQLAEYQHRVNPAESQQTLKSAVALNNQVTHPMEGIQYIRMSSKSADQSTLCLDHLRNRFPNPNDLIIALNGHLNDLVFAPETAPLFERTVATLAYVIGFEGTQPENETGRGPDVLWNLGKTSFLVIECKNGATTKTINKHDCNQLTGSMQWFKEKYGNTCAAAPLIIHPSRVFEHASTPHPNTLVMTRDKLDEFRVALRKFAAAICQFPRYGTPAEVTKLLDAYGLAGSRFYERFSDTYQKAKA